MTFSMNLTTYDCYHKLFEFELVLFGPMWITLHLEGLNFNYHLSDYSIRCKCSDLAQPFQI